MNNSEFKSRNLAKLALFAHQLKRGEQCQITKLTPLFRLVDTVQIGSAFMQYLLLKNKAYIEEGRSLAKSEVMPLEEKLGLYNIICTGFLTNDQTNNLDKVALTQVYERCSQIGGTKRLYVHATRRALPDPDLLLLEQFARYHLNGWLKGTWAYWFAQTYCCDYEGYRYKPDQRSAQRVTDIVRFFNE